MCPNGLGRRILLRQEAGMATGIMMILSAVLMTTALAILSLSQNNNERDVRYIHLHTAVAINQATLYAFGQNTHAWKAIIAHNKSAGRMACINDPNPAVKCTAGVYEELDLRTPDGTARGAPYYSYNDPARNGFRLNGTTCAFDADKIANGCLLRLRLRWYPYCGVADCRIWPEKVAIQWVYDVPEHDQHGYEKSSRRYYLPIHTLPLQGELLNGNPHR